MKQCPNCQGLELYDDSVMYCPYCNTVLVQYIRKARRQADAPRETEYEPTIGPTQIRRDNAENPHEEEPVFEQRSGRRRALRGTVVSISPTSRFMSRPVKLINAIFGGQPYQFGNPVHETIIRIEEITESRIPDRMRSLVYYGELGELDIGDDITVVAVERRGRLIVRHLEINDIETAIRPVNQVPGFGVLLFAVAMVLILFFLLSAIISFFTSGGIWILLGAIVEGIMGIVVKIIVALLPLLGVLFVYWLFFRRH